MVAAAAFLLFVYTRQSRGFVRSSDGELVVSTSLVLRGIAETCLGPEVMKIQPPPRRRSCAHRIRYVLAAFIEFILALFPSSPFALTLFPRRRVCAAQTEFRYFHFKADEIPKEPSVGAYLSEVSPLAATSLKTRRIAFAWSYRCRRRWRNCKTLSSIVDSTVSLSVGIRRDIFAIRISAPASPPRRRQKRKTTKAALRATVDFLPCHSWISGERYPVKSQDRACVRGRASGRARARGDPAYARAHLHEENKERSRATIRDVAIPREYWRPPVRGRSQAEYIDIYIHASIHPSIHPSIPARWRNKRRLEEGARACAGGARKIERRGRGVQHFAGLLLKSKRGMRENRSVREKCRQLGRKRGGAQ